MSEDEILTGKAKKAKRSEERHKQSKKRKRDDAPTESSSADHPDTTSAETAAADAKAAKKQRREEAKAAAKKAIKDSTADERAQKMAERLKRREKKKAKMEKTAAALGLDPSKKLKCSPRSLRKREKEMKEAQAASAAGSQGAENGASEGAGEGKQQRFICFIGNLPFTATTQSVEEHFAALAPSAVRHRTDPKTGKSKGFAFVEFAHYDRMKTCLEKFHHSEFQAPGDNKPRRINVELTAGGGGKSDARVEKLKGKNERLEAQRKRKTEAKVKREARKKAKGDTAKNNALAKRRNSASGEGFKAEAPEVQEGMHPARLALLQGR